VKSLTSNVLSLWMKFELKMVCRDLKWQSHRYLCSRL
jgi:hypothetical protein